MRVRYHEKKPYELWILRSFIVKWCFIKCMFYFCENNQAICSKIIILSKCENNINMTFTPYLRMMFAWYQYMTNGTYIQIWIHQLLILVYVRTLQNKLQIKNMLSYKNMWCHIRFISSFTWYNRLNFISFCSNVLILNIQPSFRLNFHRIWWRLFQKSTTGN